MYWLLLGAIGEDFCMARLLGAFNYISLHSLSAAIAAKTKSSSYNFVHSYSIFSCDIKV